MADDDSDAGEANDRQSPDEPRARHDPYERRARLAPALVTVLPIAVALLAVPTGDQDWLKPVMSLASASGGTVLLAAIARSMGRAAEQGIFPDGLPTLRALRHREAVTRAELARLHDTVARATGVALPTAEEEKHDASEADGVYRTAVAALIDATRDQARFGLLHEENRNYGFSRNLFGLRPVGRVLALLGSVAGIVLLVIAVADGSGIDVGLAIVAIVVGVAATWTFFVWLTPARVVVPATAYRDRLFEAARSLT